MRQIWKKLRNLGIAHSQASNRSDFSSENLNVHFASISFDATASSLRHFLDNVGDNAAREVFNFSEIAVSDVMNAIGKFNSQAVDINNLPQSYIHTAFPVIDLHLCALFNKSLNLDTFPQRWKQSIVLALNKVPSPGSLGDLGPISLLCYLSKTLERIVFGQKSTFVKTRWLLDWYQSGYRASHNTETRKR